MSAMQTLPFEDEPIDIFRKAMTGQGLELTELASRSGLREAEANAVVQGKRSGVELDTICEVLRLRAEPLRKMLQGELLPPNSPKPSHFWVFTSDFGGMRVNSYLAVDAGNRRAVAFDTGADASAMLETLREEGLKLELLLLTHGHGDHIYEMDRIVEKTGCFVFAPAGEGVSGARTLEAGQKLSLGELEIRVHSVPGHTPHHVAYEVVGLELPLLVVGDALFAASMGKANAGFEQSLASLGFLLSFPERTLLAPGHGPMTTVGWERVNNPFFLPSS